MLNLKESLISELSKIWGQAAAARIYRGLLIGLIALVYYITAMWGLQMSFAQTNASPIWPPSGIGFTAMLIFGYQIWPGIWLGAFLANVTMFMANHFAEFPVVCAVSGFVALGNTLEAVAGVFLLERFVGRRNPLLRVADVLKLTVFVWIAALVSATIGMDAVHFFKPLTWEVFQKGWLTWWLGDVLSILILGPLFLVMQTASWRLWNWRRITEAVFMFTLLLAVCTFIFDSRYTLSEYHYPLMYLILPLIVWSTCRFSYWGTITVSLVTLLMGLKATTHGAGPFTGPDLNLSLLLMQSFVGIVTVTGLVLAAALYERRKAETQLLSNSQLFQALVENSQDMKALMDRNGIIFYASPSVTKVLGYPLEEYVGRHFMDLTHPDDKDRLNRRLNDIIAVPGGTMEGQCRCLHKDGSWRWVEGRAHNLFNDPAVNAIVINYHDVTQRKEFEEMQHKGQLALQESELRFRTMADTAPVMIWMSDADMISTFFNKAWLDFRGKTIEEELGHGWIQGLNPEDIRRCWAIYMKAFASRERFTMDYRLNRADGKYRWILATAVPRFTGDGKFNGYIGSCIDITERKMAEEVLKRDKESLETLVDERSKELLSTQQELKHASRLADIGTLAATVAHELRNPLGVIQMAAYNLKRKTKTLEGDRHLINIEKKVWEGNRIIDNLLSYSRIRIPSYEQIQLFPLLDECVSNTQVRFEDYDVTIEKNYENGSLNLIEADPHQLKEVFANILNNACQALVDKKGTIEINVKRQNENQVSFAFQDNGVGIEEEDLKRIFVPFFTRKSKGTGLGMTICNEIVNLHQGKIEVQSVKSQGTCVIVTLPIARRKNES